MPDHVAPGEKTPPIVIVGGGLAGVFCALKLAPHPVLLLAPGGVGPGSASQWAQGGVAAAVAEGDTPEVHAQDTINAGAGLVDEDIALGVAREARARIDDLLDYGAPFDRDALGKLQPSREAAHSHRRIVRVKGDTAGRVIMETLAAAVAKTPSIEVIEGFSALDILVEAGRARGLFTQNGAGDTRLFRCGALVLATGGVGHLYRVTTNPTDACGAGLAMSARAGALIADPEFVQFHPTAIDIGADPAPLATESLRGEGAIIVDRDGRRFLFDADPAGELAARDIVARGVHASIAAGRGAFLDARAAVGAAFPERFPTVYASCMAAGIDPCSAPIPIAPAAHYHMGGVATDARGRTSLDGLWAAGEVASTGLHGANRLASNSLLEALVYGARVAADIAAAPPQDAGRCEATPPRPTTNDDAVEDELRGVMSADVGVVRDGAGLKRALAAIEALQKNARGDKARNMLVAAQMIAAAAFARKESRGAHRRADFPLANEALRHRSRLTLAMAQSISREAQS